MLIQVVPPIILALAKLSEVGLIYATGTIPITLTTVYEGEFFLSAFVAHNENGSQAKVTIQEFDGSNYFWKDYNLKADEFFQLNLSDPAGFTARKFYSGLKIVSNKDNVHFQIRGFYRKIEDMSS